MSTKIDDERRDDICKMGKGSYCCRYLVCGAEGFECAKHTSLKETIDRRVRWGQFTARGDNCEGLHE